MFKNKLLLILIALFTIKVIVGALLKAENGDTYDFFKIAYYLKDFDWTYESKRMPFLPLLIAFFPVDWYVWIGRLWINIFYFGSVVVFYRYFRLVLKLKSHKVEKGKEKSLSPVNNNVLPLLATLVFATNIVVLENSFYILADAIFLFWNLLYLYKYKKDGLKNTYLLILIAAAAFYTRPEGLILFILTGIFILINLVKKCTDVSIVKTIVLGIFSASLIIPYFLRNYLLYGKILYSGYLSDEAGFIFDTQTVLMRSSSILFGVGGIWLLSTIYLIVIKKRDFKFNLNSPEIWMFILYTPLLFLWGPYLRLYTIPITLLIIFVLKNAKILTKHNSTKQVVTSIIIFAASVAIYTFVVQKYDHSDLGYRKIGKGIALLGSLLPVSILLLKDKFKVVKTNFLILISLSIVLINVSIFVDKFRITRYKYSTIKEAILYFQNELASQGNIAYWDESGVPVWYLKDFKQTYRFSSNKGDFQDWVEKNNIMYLLTTEEFGYKDYFYSTIGLKDKKIVSEFKSPFFYGSTRIVELSD